MATIQKSLTGQQAGASLQGTLTAPATAAAGQAAAPPEISDDDQSAAAIDSYKKKLQDIMASHQDVDYDKLYADMQNKMAAMQPTTPKPNPLIAAAAAFGSPQAGMNAIQQSSEHGAQEKQINEKRLALNLELLDKKGEQERNKGQFQRALETNAAASQLEEQLGRIRSERQAKQAESLAKVQGQAKLDVEAERSHNRIEVQKMRDDVNRERIHAQEAKSGSLKLSPADKAQMDAEYAAAKRDLSIGTGFNQETMTMPSADQAQAAREDYKRVTDDINARYTKKQLGVAPANAGLSARPETAAAPSGGAAWAQGLAEAKRQREAAATASKK